MSIWIKGATVVPMTGKDDQMEEASIYIEGNTIAYIGPFLPGKQAETIIDAKGKVAMPGLINCHTHLGMSYFRNYSDDMALEEWLGKIWPMEAQLTGDDIAASSALSMAELIESGTTTFMDMYYEMDRVAEETEKSGLRGFLGRGLTEDDRGQEKLDDARRFFNEWNGAANGRINVVVSPHAVYTNGLGYLEEAAELAEQLGAITHTHANETATEVANSMESFGRSPIAQIEASGLFNRVAVAAHCVVVDDGDLDILAKHGVSVAHNPASNMKLASGFAPVMAMREKGINVCLGTDSNASNNVLDLFETMFLASLIAKGTTNDPKALTAYEVLEMGTVNGAKALGMEGRLGVLTEGALADVILVDFESTHLQPRNDVYASLVYSARGSDVDTVIVDGAVLMENRKHLIIDIDGLKQDVADRMDRLKQRQVKE